jgi:hypothetical protein
MQPRLGSSTRLQSCYGPADGRTLPLTRRQDIVVLRLREREGRDITAANRTHGPYRSSVVRGKALTVARWIGRGTFKAAALIGALFLIVALWLWDASILTRAADQNLQLIKAATRVLPPDWASKTESALRIFGADRALLLVEGVAVAKLIMLGIAQPFRRRRP